MITISHDHYNKLIDLVRLQSKNMELLYPSNLELTLTLSTWK